MGALLEKTKFSGTLRACEEAEMESKMRSIFYGIAVVINLSKESLTRQSVKGFPKGVAIGPVRESNPGPLAPKARIMPLDQQAGDVKCGLGRVFYSLLLLERVD